MTEPLTLSLPLPPNMANARQHWRVKHRTRKAYLSALDALRSARILPPPPSAPLSPVVLSSTLYLWAHMDDDNALARIKYAADWLVRSGYLVDDKRPHCRFTVPEQAIDRTDPRLVITLTPQEAA